MRVDLTDLAHVVFGIVLGIFTILAIAQSDLLALGLILVAVALFLLYQTVELRCRVERVRDTLLDIVQEFLVPYLLTVGLGLTLFQVYAGL